MSDLGAPGGTRPIPNASECHARARVTRDPAAPLHVSSRARPRRAKAGARAFPETTTDIPLPRPPLFLRPRHERRDERPREPLVTTGRRFRERYVAHVLNDALPATKSRSTARHLPRTARASLRSSRSPPLPSHENSTRAAPSGEALAPQWLGGFTSAVGGSDAKAAAQAVRRVPPLVRRRGRGPRGRSIDADLASRRKSMPSLAARPKFDVFACVVFRALYARVFLPTSEGVFRATLPLLSSDTNRLRHKTQMASNSALAGDAAGWGDKNRTGGWNESERRK